MHPIQTQGHPIAGISSSSSAPATPAAALLLNRSQRDVSLGATGASNKRKILAGGLGTLPTYSSNLARHASMTPGTPRAHTPVRAGSVGPRSQKTGAGIKKIPPQGSRQSGVPRKNKPGKSGLSRVKGTRNKNSPSSTNDSELSDAESGTGDEEEEAGWFPFSALWWGMHTNFRTEEENSDNTKYCTCQSVSYGDMVACDNDKCPYEWFHWGCVGLLSSPKGVWICPVCEASDAKAR